MAFQGGLLTKYLRWKILDRTTLNTMEISVCAYIRGTGITLPKVYSSSKNISCSWNVNICSGSLRRALKKDELICLPLGVSQ